MIKEIALPKTVITQEAIFDFSKLYKDLKSWFDNKLYVFHELSHEKKDSAEGTELNIFWVGEKEVDDYFKFKIEITFIGSEIENLQSEKGDIVYQGSLKIITESTLIMDYKNKFKDGKFMEFLSKIYNNVLILKKRTRYEGKLDSEVKELKALMKEHLQIPT